MSAKARALRGSTERCPRCGSRSVGVFDIDSLDLPAEVAAALAGHKPTIAICQNCKCLWEPFAAADLWTTTEARPSFREPCNNCAFRPGSNEQEDRAKWRELIANLKAGASFYCHKGVPVDDKAEHGFAYPQRRTGAYDTGRMRLCRGFLNALRGLWKIDLKPRETPHNV